METSVKNIFGAALLLVTLLLPVVSQAFTTQITDTYQMSEGETTIMARERLIEKIKKTASQKAGSYIEQDTVIDSNNRLNDTIKVISSSLVKVDVINEKKKIIDDRIALEITAKVNVDDGVLKERIKKIKNDSVAQKKLIELAHKSDKLSQELHNLKISLIESDITELEQESMLQEKNRLSNEINKLKASFNNVFKVNYSALLEKARLKREQEEFQQKQKKLKAKLEKIARDREFNSMIKTIFEGGISIADVSLTEWKFHTLPDFYIKKGVSPDDKSIYDKYTQKRKRFAHERYGSPFKRNSHDKYDEVNEINIIVAFDPRGKEKQKAMEKWFLNSKRFSEYHVFWGVKVEWTEGIKEEVEVDGVTYMNITPYRSNQVTVVYDPETKKYRLRTQVLITFSMSSEEAKQIGGFKLDVSVCDGSGNPCVPLM